MKLVASAHILCWVIVSSFAVTSAIFGLYVPRLYRDSWCANTLTDPLSFLLGYFAPAASCAVLALGALWYRGAIRVRSLAYAAGVSTFTLVALVAYGIWFFRTKLPGHPLAEIVWWMKSPWAWP
jgi:hypothetical protein